MKRVSFLLAAVLILVGFHLAYSGSRPQGLSGDDRSSLGGGTHQPGVNKPPTPSPPTATPSPVKPGQSLPPIPNNPYTGPQDPRTVQQGKLLENYSRDIKKLDGQYKDLQSQLFKTPVSSSRYQDIQKQMDNITKQKAAISDKFNKGWGQTLGSQAPPAPTAPSSAKTPATTPPPRPSTPVPSTPVATPQGGQTYEQARAALEQKYQPEIDKISKRILDISNNPKTWGPEGGPLNAEWKNLAKQRDRLYDQWGKEAMALTQSPLGSTPPARPSGQPQSTIPSTPSSPPGSSVSGPSGPSRPPSPGQSSTKTQTSFEKPRNYNDWKALEAKFDQMQRQIDQSYLDIRNNNSLDGKQRSALLQENWRQREELKHLRENYRPDMQTWFRWYANQVYTGRTPPSSNLQSGGGGPQMPGIAPSRSLSPGPIAGSPSVPGGPSSPSQSSANTPQTSPSQASPSPYPPASGLLPVPAGMNKPQRDSSGQKTPANSPPPTSDADEFQKYLIANGYADWAETGRQLFYSPEYNATIGTWGLLADNYLTWPLAKGVSALNLLGKYYFANNLDEQSVAVLAFAGKQKELFGPYSYLVKGFTIGMDYALWGTDPDPLRQGLYNQPQSSSW